MSDLDRLFYWHGIAAEFYNFRGQLTPVPVENRLQILKAMGVDVSSPKVIAKEAYELDVRPWTSWLRPLTLAEESKDFSIDLNFSPEDLHSDFKWSAVRQDGLCYQGELNPSLLHEVGDYVDNKIRYSRRRFIPPFREIGYYQFSLSNASRREDATLALTPTESYQPDWLRSEKKLWGIVLQLYSLRSERNWGIGDFSDLTELTTLLADLGGGLIGLNPFHALQSDLVHDVSPYSPSDRRFLNPLYIDVERSPDFNRVSLSAEEQRLIRELREEHFVDYARVQVLKLGVLRRCFKAFVECAPKASYQIFKDYIAAWGQPLIAFSVYEAEHCQAFEDGGDEAIALKSEDLLLGLLSERVKPESPVYKVAFHAYLQYLAEEQLEACQRCAEEAGMALGLIRDLAVGASGGGAEVQSNLDLFCLDVAIGAPPDPMALTGQNWGMPPMDPAQLRKSGFAHYINLLRANMSHCGALRIDHAMSLMRLWWCPPQAKADKGSYIYYPMAELMGLLCLESHLNQCAIIGEDLGVVPDEFRAAISAAKVISNKVFYFERWSDFEFKHPRDYAFHALAMLDNHDVPTIRSWWNATDLQLREELQLLEAHILFEEQLANRHREKQSLVKLLEAEGCLPASWQTKDLSSEIDFVLIEAILLFISTANSQLLVIQLEDLMEMDEPVNVPGTYNEYPNWRRKLKLETKALFAKPCAQKVLRAINQKRAINI